MAFLEVIKIKIEEFFGFHDYDGIGGFQVTDRVYTHLKTLYKGEKRLEFEKISCFFCLFDRLVEKIIKLNKENLLNKKTKPIVQFRNDFLKNINSVFVQYQPFFNQFTAILPGEEHFQTPIPSSKFDEFIDFFFRIRSKTEKGI